MLDSFAVQFWLSAGRRVPAQKVPEPSTHVHVELNPPGGDCPTGSTSPSWRNAPKQTKSEPDFPNSDIIRPSTINCSATELIDPKMHSIARAWASCQVQFCFRFNCLVENQFSLCECPSISPCHEMPSSFIHPLLVRAFQGQHMSLLPSFFLADSRPRCR